MSNGILGTSRNLHCYFSVIYGIIHCMENLLLAEHSKSPYLSNPSFSGHQTFPFRYTWLKKGVDAVMDNPNVFTDDDAPVILGVGKNMVSSIRHWCSVAGLITTNGNQQGRFVPTIFGKPFLMTTKDLTRTSMILQPCG